MKTVLIGGKQRPIRYGFNALAEYENITGDNLLSFSVEDLSVGNAIKLIYIGLLFGAKKNGEDPDFTFEDVGDWLDERKEAMVEIFEIYGDSLPKVTEKKK